MAYLAYLTTHGAAQIAQAQIDGTSAAWSTFAVGDGNGAEVTASADVTALVNTVYTGSISTLTRDSDDTSLLIATLIVPASAGDFYVREIGIYNTDGELVVYAAYPETYKSLDGGLTTMTIKVKVKVSEDANVTLFVDTDAYATKEYVTDATVAAASALAEAHTFITDLTSEDAATFDGTQDVSQGVTGVLPVTHGGTGATSLDDVTVGAATEATHAVGADTATIADALSYDIRTATASTEITTTETDAELIISPADDTDGVYWMTTAEYTTDDDGIYYDTDGNEINEYSAESAYAYGDLVVLDGVVYECIQANGVGVYETVTETSIAAIDADEMTDTGLYYVDTAMENSNLPTDNGGYLEVYDDTESAYIVQTFTDSAGVMYTRTAAISEEETEDDNGETVTEGVYTWTDWQSGGGGDYVPLSGNAGEVSYYTTTADTTTVDESSADAIETADAVTISDGTSGTAWVKVIHLTGDSPTVTAGGGWSWTDGESPELESGCFVVACWLGSAGLLTYHNIG